MQTVNSQTGDLHEEGARSSTSTGTVLYGAVPNNTVFKGFGGTCDARNNGDTVVRYDQLADRWLIVMPIFRRAAARPDQPPVWKPGDTVYSQPARRHRTAGSPRHAVRAAARRHRRTRAQPAAARNGASAGSGAAAGAGSVLDVLRDQHDIRIRSAPYYRYEFLRPLFPDYPRPAVWPDGYYVPTSTSDDFIEKHACVVDRNRMLKGEPATEQCVVIDGVNFLNNADLDGKTLPPAGAPNIMMAAGGTQLKGDFDDDGIYVWQFHVDWKDPTKTKVTGPEKIAVAPYHYLCNGQLSNCVPQPGTDRRLDAQGDKLMARVVYRRVTANRVDRRGALREHRSGRRRRPLVRVPGRRRIAAVKLHQQGTYAPDGFYRWMASPAIDKLGNIGIGYSFGGTPHFAGQRFAGRLAVGSAGHADAARDDPRRGRSRADQHQPLGGLLADGRRSERRLHDLVRRRLLQEGRDELLDADRRVPDAGV